MKAFAPPPQAIPQQLHAVESWLNWKQLSNGNKSPADQHGKAVGYNSTEAWLPMLDAIEKTKSNPSLHLGISLTKSGLLLEAGYLWCLDFDGFACGSQIDDGLMFYIRKLATYIEDSPSGTGFKAFLVSDKHPQKMPAIKFGASEFAAANPDVKKYQNRAIEIFSEGRFLAFTGKIFDGNTPVTLRKIPAQELSNLLDELNQWALDTGGSGWGKSQKHPTEPKIHAESVSADEPREYAKPLREDMATVLLYVDAEDEQVYTDTANGLARTYAEDGRGLFLDYCSRSTIQKHQEHLAAGKADERYTRALREVTVRPEGYTCKHIIELAQRHPDWPNGFEVQYENDFEINPNGLFSDYGTSPAQMELPLVTNPENNRFSFKTASEVRNMPPMRWRIKQLLPERGIGLIFGASASGKSFLGFDMGACITLGRSFYGRKVVRCPVVYVALEGGAGVSKRVQAWEKFHSQQIPDIFRIVTDPLSLLESDGHAFAGDLNAAGLSGGVIIVDTLNQSAPGADENSPSDMGKIIANAMIVQRLTDSLVLLVHHTGKDKTKGPRGHSSLGAALDVAIEVERNAIGREWSIYKLKDGEDGLSFPFKLESVNLGIDEEGDPITSCVAVSDLFRINKPKPPRGKNQGLVLAAIKDYAANSTSLSYDEALAAGSGALLDVQPKHRKERATDAINRLVQDGHLTLDRDTLGFHL